MTNQNLYRVTYTIERTEEVGVHADNKLEALELAGGMLSETNYSSDKYKIVKVELILDKAVVEKALP